MRKLGVAYFVFNKLRERGYLNRDKLARLARRIRG